MRKQVDYNVIKGNYQEVEKMSSKKVIAVLKNNGYNTGLLKTTRAVFEQGCDLVMVTNVSEAIQIKKQFPMLNVLIANILTEQEFVEISNYKFELMVDSLAYIDKYYDYLINHNWHLKVNIGMNRFGFDDINQLIAVSKMNITYITGIYSHVPLEYEDDELYDEQIKKFIKYYSALPISPKYVHLENSATMQKHDSRLDFCTHVRVGILLYGFNNKRLTPAITVNCKVVKIRAYEHDDTFSYGLNNIAVKGTKIATIDIGYGDGIIDSRCSLPFYINNKPYYQIGNQSMSHTYLVVDNQIKVEDFVEVYGKNITIQDHAKEVGYPCSKLLSYLN